ncbi:hypothetical protein GCM10027162_22370 [Streptomyces incanus]
MTTLFGVPSIFTSPKAVRTLRSVPPDTDFPLLSAELAESDPPQAARAMTSGAAARARAAERSGDRLLGMDVSRGGGCIAKAKLG